MIACMCKHNIYVGDSTCAPGSIHIPLTCVNKTVGVIQGLGSDWLLPQTTLGQTMAKQTFFMAGKKFQNRISGVERDFCLNTIIK